MSGFLARGWPARAILGSSPESESLFSLSSAWSVASLETDLVRRPRVRGTASRATVGIERRLSLTFVSERAGGSLLGVPRVDERKLQMDGVSRRALPGLGVGDSSVYLVDPASSHMLVSKIKPCKCQHMPPNG